MNDALRARTPAPPESDLVVILLGTFNGAKYLRQQLDSIAAQTHLRWRLVVADDGSRDETLAVLQTFSAKYPTQVSILRRDPVRSARDNFFRLLRHAGRADYFVFCDQDDVWSVNKLERLVQQCQQSEDQHAGQPCLVYSDLAVVDSDLGLLHPSFMRQIRVRPFDITYKTVLTENSVPGCAMLFNAALADVFRAREFNQTKAIMHDWWMVLLASTTGQITYVPEPLVSYRQHEANALGSVDRSGLIFTLSKVFWGNRAATLDTYGQAAEFLHAYGDLLDANIREEMRSFASLEKHHKLDRIRMLLKYQILKQTFGRRMYQLLRA